MFEAIARMMDATVWTERRHILVAAVADRIAAAAAAVADTAAVVVDMTAGWVIPVDTVVAVLAAALGIAVVEAVAVAVAVEAPRRRVPTVSTAVSRGLPRGNASPVIAGRCFFVGPLLQRRVIAGIVHSGTGIEAAAGASHGCWNAA